MRVGAPSRLACNWLVGFLSLGMATLSLGQTWNVDANGTWNTAANWSPATVPNGAGVAVTLGSVITANRVINVSANTQLGTITINNSNDYTVSGTGQLQFNVTSGSAGINVQNSGSPTISAKIRTADPFLINNTGTGLLTVSGVISDTGGSQTLTISGTGTTLLSGANTYKGVTSVTGGILQISNAAALGNTSAGTTVSSGAQLQLIGGISTATEALTLNGSGISGDGALQNASGNNTWNGNVTLGSDAMIVSASSGDTLTIAGATVALGAHTATFDGAGDTVVSKVISGTSGNLVKSGAGTLKLSGTSANTFTGTTTVSGGTLQLSKTAGINAIAGSSITVNTGGTLLLGAANQIANATNMTLAGGTFSTGATTGFAETLGTLTLSGSSAIDLGTASHLLNFANSSALSGSWSGTLTIYGWNGTLSGGTEGRIFFGSNASGLTSAQLAQINFDGLVTGATLLSTGELVPVAVPEAPPILAALLLAGIFIFRERRFLGKFLSAGQA